MADAHRAPTPSERGSGDAAKVRSFRRARVWLWGASALSVVLGVGLHDWASSSSWAHLAWLAGVALALGQPLRQLLAFLCPRCGNVFLATGSWRDFLALGRILWSQRCSRCAFSVADDGPPSSGSLPESRPV